MALIVNLRTAIWQWLDPDNSELSFLHSGDAMGFGLTPAAPNTTTIHPMS